MVFSMVVCAANQRDHVFNKATATINVQVEQDGVKVTKDSQEIATEKERKMLYNGFVKAGYYMINETSKSRC
jgi:H2-forming N5,N10-methylenetetrahydromethanopterin dehydrogenase-like enzyme